MFLCLHSDTNPGHGPMVWPNMGEISEFSYWTSVTDYCSRGGCWLQGPKKKDCTACLLIWMVLEYCLVSTFIGKYALGMYVHLCLSLSLSFWGGREGEIQRDRKRLGLRKQTIGKSRLEMRILWKAQFSIKKAILQITILYVSKCLA